jgi:hypothetical protein
MLRNLNDLKGFTIGARDGDIGRVRQFYFDDDTWTVRYLVVTTGSWLGGRAVLISPLFLAGGINDRREAIMTGLTRDQVRHCPPPDADKPVSRQYEQLYFKYYAIPLYWSASGRWGAGLLPSNYSSADMLRHRQNLSETPVGDVHLRSTADVERYVLHAPDGDLGQVEDFVVDENWALRYLVVDTINWWPSKHVLLSPHWIDHIGWSSREVFVGIPRRVIKGAPEYTGTGMIDETYEKKLFDYYGRGGDREAVRVRMKEKV